MICIMHATIFQKWLLPSALALGFEWETYSRYVRTYREALNEGSILAMYVRAYVRTCLSRSGMSISAHVHVATKLPVDEFMRHVH